MTKDINIKECVDPTQNFTVQPDGRCVSSKLSLFFLYFVQSSAKFSHALRRVIEGPFSVMREFCYAVPEFTVHAASS